MGGLRTAFIHNGTRQQSSFIPRCLWDTQELVCRQRGNTVGRGVVARAERQFRQHKSYLCVYHINILLIYSLECYPNKVLRGRKSARIQQCWYCRKSRHGLKMSEQTLLTLSHFPAAPTGFIKGRFKVL